MPFKRILDSFAGSGLQPEPDSLIGRYLIEHHASWIYHPQV